MASKFGQLLLWANLITEKQLEEALEYQRAHGGRLGEILSQLGSITADDLTRTLGMKYGVPAVNLDLVKIDGGTLELISSETARLHRVVPLNRSGSSLMCALEDPARVDSINEVEFQTGCRLQPVLVTTAMMDTALNQYYPATPAKGTARPKHDRPVESAMVARLSARMNKLSKEKLEYVRRFLDAID